jgi:hypothetical protein
MLVGVLAGKLRSSTCPPGEDAHRGRWSPVIPTSFPYVRSVRTLASLVPVSVLLSAHSWVVRPCRKVRFAGLIHRPLGMAANLKAGRATAVDRQVGKRPVDCHHCPDCPLGHVDKGHRGERVDLVVEGELAPAGHDHHQHLHLVVPMRLDPIPQAEPDQVGLQVLSIQPPQGAWPVPGRGEAGQVDRSNSVVHPTIFSSPYRTRWSQRTPRTRRHLSNPVLGTWVRRRGRDGPAPPGAPCLVRRPCRGGRGCTFWPRPCRSPGSPGAPHPARSPSR